MEWRCRRPAGSAVGDGSIGHSEMQERKHFMDTESVEQDDLPPFFFDRLGMQERKHFMDTNSPSMKKNFARRGVQDLKRPPLLGCLDLERGV